MFGMQFWALRQKCCGKFFFFFLIFCIYTPDVRICDICVSEKLLIIKYINIASSSNNIRDGITPNVSPIDSMLWLGYADRCSQIGHHSTESRGLTFEVFCMSLSYALNLTKLWQYRSIMSDISLPTFSPPTHTRRDVRFSHQAKMYG